MREKQIEKYLAKKIDELGGISRKFISPQRRGVPDRICLLPYGLVYFVECKAPNGKLSKLQELEKGLMESLGCNYSVVWDYESVDRLIHKLGRRLSHLKYNPPLNVQY